MASHDYGHDARMAAAKQGHAMPDGSYPVRDRAELGKAIQAIGRASDRGKVMAYLKRRARELGATAMLPDSWRS